MEITEITREEYEEEKREKKRAYNRKYDHSEKGKAYRNSEHAKSYFRQWEAKNRGRKKVYRHKRLYNMTLEQREAMFVAQNNACAICKSTETWTKGWHVDHCHKTGVVRGILCQACNMMLGNAKDDVSTLRAAITYLTKGDD